jgi:hypothetical protein
MLRGAASGIGRNEMNKLEENEVEKKDQSSVKCDCSDLDQIAFNIVLGKMVRKRPRTSDKRLLKE